MILMDEHFLRQQDEKEEEKIDIKDKRGKSSGQCLFNKQNALNYPVILRLRTVPANKSTLISRLKCSKKSNYLRQYGKDVKQ